MVKDLEKLNTAIDHTLDLEVLGLLHLHGLRLSGEDCPSMAQTAPTFPHRTKEFGAGMSASQLSEAVEELVGTIAYNLFKLQILKETYSLEDIKNGWMIRLVHALNDYPECCYKKDFPLFDGRTQAEVIFFAKSMKGAQQIQKRLQAALGHRSIYEAVNDALLAMSDTLEEKLFGEDKEIKALLKLFSPPENQKDASKKAPTAKNNSQQKKKGK